MTAPAVLSVVTEQCVVDGMAEDTYHLDPVPGGSLSSTGAREILNCPARFAWNQEHGREDTKSFDLGKVAHALILGTGAQYQALPYTDWTTKRAQQDRKDARAAGLTPLTLPELAQAEAMAAAFRASPAGALLTPDGLPERSLFWIDDETGVWCRARVDWANALTYLDLKTTADAHPGHLGKSVADFGYHVQEAFYERGIRALNLADGRAPEFLFAFVEKKQPHFVTTAVLDAEARSIGDELVSRALRRYAECQRTGVWPGYPTDIVTVSLPRWATYLPEETAA